MTSPEITYDWFLQNGWPSAHSDEHIVRRWQSSFMPQRRPMLLSDLNHIRWRLIFESYNYTNVIEATADWYNPSLSNPDRPKRTLHIIDHDRLHSHFADDNGETLPVGITYGPALWECRHDRARFQQQIDSISDAGYDYIRFWCWLGYQQFWSGREVTPINFINEDGVTIPGWTDWAEQVSAFGQIVKNAGLQLYVSSGDARIFTHQHDLSEHAMKLGKLLTASGVTIMAADQHEPEQQTWVNQDLSPSEIQDIFVEPLIKGAGYDFIRLSGAPLDGANPEQRIKWQQDLQQKHGTHGYGGGDLVGMLDEPLRLIDASIGYPLVQLGMESFPPGPGECDHSGMLNTVGENVLLAAVNWAGKFAYTFNPQVGTHVWDGLLADQPGFSEVPAVQDLLPVDLMSAYRIFVDWPDERAPFHKVNMGPDRINTLITEDTERFISFVYTDVSVKPGLNQTTLQARRPLRFTVIDPETLNVTEVNLPKGHTYTPRYTTGRIIVGSFL